MYFREKRRDSRRSSASDKSVKTTAGSSSEAVAFPATTEYIESAFSLSIPAMITSDHTILVVEDEQLLLDLLREMLEAEGYRVITATDGKEAVEVYRSERGKVSLVLSDMGLPSMGGWEVLRELRTINPGVKVILSSGFMDPKVRRDVIQSGAQDFIQKPYVPEKVIRQIHDSIFSET